MKSSSVIYNKHVYVLGIILSTLCLLGTPYFFKMHVICIHCIKIWLNSLFYLYTHVFYIAFLLIIHFTWTLFFVLCFLLSKYSLGISSSLDAVEIHGIVFVYPGRNVRAKKVTALSRAVFTLFLETAMYSLDGHLKAYL